MNWSSVKNLLIAILVAANLFLIFNIARQDRTRAYLSEEEVHGAVLLLAERGLSVPVESVPLKKFKAPVYESLYSDEYYTEAAQSLTGSEREMLYTLPSGGISITAENGAWVEFDTEFGFRYAEFDIPDAYAYTEITAESFAEAAKNNSAPGTSRMKTLSETAAEFLCKRVGDDSPLTAEFIDSFVGDDGYTYLLALQTLDGCKVYSHYAVCVFDGDKLIFAHGRWYFSPIDEDYTTELFDQVNILFTDLTTLKTRSIGMFAAEGEIYSEPPQAVADDTALPAVTAISPCYAVYWNADKTALYFIPAWQINHIDSLTIVYNATNSTVYSSNK